MKHFLCLLAFLPWANLAAADCNPTLATQLPALGRDYREMREVSLRGDPEWDARMAKAMDQLRQCLDAEHAGKKRVLELLGKPDRVAKPNSMLYRMAVSSLKASETPPDLERSREALIYQWRGLHDFLFFLSDGKRILVSAWWAALD